MRLPLPSSAHLSALAAGGVLVAACGVFEPKVPSRAPLAEQWLTRSKLSYQAGDFEDAYDAGKHALAVAKNDPDIRLAAANAALARLEFSEAALLTEGLATSDAQGVRGRALWYAGDLEAAADALDAMLADPKVKDPWARDISRLARLGHGRHPFRIEGGIVAAVPMPKGIAQVDLGAAHVVPCELEGERILALIATGVSEVVVDASSRREPAWVSLRFGDRIEVNDVPALAVDLTPISRQLGVPIKALLGVNFLRHVHATFDRRGDQFVIRKQDATPPPDASRVPVWYVRGGGMTFRASVTIKEGGETPLLIDSGRFFPLALEEIAWKKAGIDPKALPLVGEVANVRRGNLPTFRLGGFDLAKIPAFYGIELGEAHKALGVDFGGVVGAELLTYFRVTFADEGRFVWMEVDPGLVAPPSMGPTAPSPSSAPRSSPVAPRPAPSGSSERVRAPRGTR
ncbi:MAG: hypothetical protein WCI05_05585 [Myxococcales bacterium]